MAIGNKLALSVLLATVLATAVALAGLASSMPAEAQSSHRATRSFSPSWVAPGGQVEVRVSASGYGAVGQVVETLPEGFRYAGSSLSSGAVEVSGQTVEIVLLGVESFTYTAVAPEAGGHYAFSGVPKNDEKAEVPVGGASVLRVGGPPTATPMPTATPTPEPTATATPMPTATPTPEPTATPVPTATPTPEPTATPMPTAMPTPEPTATPTPTATPMPEPTATPEPTPTATPEPAPPAPEPGDEGGMLWWQWVIVAGIAALFSVVLLAVWMLARRRREERLRQ